MCREWIVRRINDWRKIRWRDKYKSEIGVREEWNRWVGINEIWRLRRIKRSPRWIFNSEKGRRFEIGKCFKAEAIGKIKWDEVVVDWEIFEEEYVTVLFRFLCFHMELNNIII
jgi:hypothetical protein